MKKFYTLLFSSLFIAASAQVSDRVETDCQSNSESIYNVLGSGKALIVASKGLDCSICVSRAGGWGNWATNNKSQVEVWGAMTYTYSNNIPTCGSMNAWVSTHGWSDIFTFADSNEYYFSAGTPRYLVYDPSDSTLIYQGGSHSQARTLALNASMVNLNVAQNELEKLSIYQSRDILNFEGIPAGKTDLEIYNLAGKREKTFELSADNNVLNISDLPKGIYLIRLSNSSSALTRKIVIS